MPQVTAFNLRADDRLPEIEAALRQESIGMLLIALLGAWSLLVGVAQQSDTQVVEEPSAGR